MLRQRLYTFLLALLLQPVVGAADSQSYLQPGLGVGLGKKESAQGLLEHRPVKDVSCKRFSTGPIETTLCDYETIEGVTEGTYTDRHGLVATPFFNFFCVDLYYDCLFWQENGFCMSRECGITIVDESEIPENWRAAALSEVETPSKDQASPQFLHRSGSHKSRTSATQATRLLLPWFRLVFFRRRVWGWLCQPHPEYRAIQGASALVLRVVSRIGSYLSAYDYCGDGLHDGDACTLEVKNVISTAQAVAKFDETVMFCGKEHFTYAPTCFSRCTELPTPSQVLKHDFKQHFRNVTRIMDCVGCDKCRLWGKTQTSGVGIALKLLFGLDDSALDLAVNTTG